MKSSQSSIPLRPAEPGRTVLPMLEGEGDHYPWKVYVNQITGERTKPPSR
jgi:hypothetical protein